MNATTRTNSSGPASAIVEIERPAGEALLQSPRTNKGTAFTREERRALGLSGFLPPYVETLDQQMTRAYAAFCREPSPIAKYQFLRRLEDANEVLFHALLERHLDEMLPIVYTPTVGEATLRFSDLFERPRGLSIARDDDDSLLPASEAVEGYPCDDARIIVVTDSSAILGLGDQGYNGLAIPIGKVALYVAGGGVNPSQAIPAVLDVGTDRAPLLGDPLYLGVRRARLRGDAHLAFVRAFVDAVRARWPKAIVQWEDFSKETAFGVLDAFRDALPSFNDDIQGTGAVALAGLLSAGRLEGRRLADEQFLVYGAGAGGIGVARAIHAGLVREGLSPEEARAHIFVFDSRGLVVESRATGAERYKHDFATPDEVVRGWCAAGLAGAAPTLEETISAAKITALLGLSGQRGAFDERAVRAVLRNVARPIVFPLSNPTSACEATPADILAWTSGRAIVATGSPFEPVVLEGRTYEIGQGNNAFVFPGLGFGASLVEARKITDRMVSEAAYALADHTAARFPDRLYPPVRDLREACECVAVRVARTAIAEGVAGASDLPSSDGELEALVRRSAWTPRYVDA